jgi:error-prone DNA polymerase
LIEAAEGWIMAVVPPAHVDKEFAARFRRDADALRRLALPLMVAGSSTLGGGDVRRPDGLADTTRGAGGWLLATGDVRYHVAGRRRLADVLTAVRTGRTIDEIGFDAEPNAERRPKSLEEVSTRFSRHPDAIANTLRVLEAARGFNLDQLRYEYPGEVLEPGRTAMETLRARVDKPWQNAGPSCPRKSTAAWSTSSG